MPDRWDKEKYWWRSDAVLFTSFEIFLGILGTQLIGNKGGILYSNLAKGKYPMDDMCFYSHFFERNIFYELVNTTKFWKSR